MTTNTLSINTTVKANKPNCPCKGGGSITVTGKIKKVITNHSGSWYYLDTGSTIKHDWIIEIL
ncbi:MAG: hypothetical protein ACXW2E_01485 [Nitrososphaeraceae archaeon]